MWIIFLESTILSFAVFYYKYFTANAERQQLMIVECIIFQLDEVFLSLVIIKVLKNDMLHSKMPIWLAKSDARRPILLLKSATVKNKQKIA